MIGEEGLARFKVPRHGKEYIVNALFLLSFLVQRRNLFLTHIMSQLLERMCQKQCFSPQSAPRPLLPSLLFLFLPGLASRRTKTNIATAVWHLSFPWSPLLGRSSVGKKSSVTLPRCSHQVFPKPAMVASRKDI